MNTPGRWLLIAAGIAGASGVAFGAFAAHGLEQFLIERSVPTELIPKRLSQFDVGARYQLFHAVALLALGALALISQGADDARLPRFRISLRAIGWAGVLFVAGILCFSGSLYLLVVTGKTWLGMITPIGGICWIIGWLMIVFLPRRVI